MTILRRFFTFVTAVGSLGAWAFAQTPGGLDPTFDVGAGVEAAAYADVAIGADGKAIVVGGNGLSGKIVRINPDGTLDRNFAVGTAFGQTTDEAPVCVAVQGDGKVVVGGFFRFFDGSSRRAIVRLNADGSLDTAFDPGSLLEEVAPFSPVFIREIAIQSDGKIVAAGGFRYTGGDGASRVNLVRFNANGTIDGTFRPALDLTYGIEALALAPGGQFVLNYNAGNDAGGSAVFETVRLLNSGARDSAFDDGTGSTQHRPPADGGDPQDFSAGATAIEVQSDGSVLIGGLFDKFNGVARAGLARLTATGAVDPNFVPAGFRFVFSYPGQTQLQNFTGTIDTVQMVGGGVLVSGNFTHVGSPSGLARRGLARLNGNGTLDELFEVGAAFGPNFYPEVTGVAVRPGTGEIVAAGSFSQYDGAKVPGVVQLGASGALDATFLARMQQGFDKPPNVLAVQEDGRLLVGGPFSRIGAKVQWGFARLHADGSLDTSFDIGAGFVETAADGTQFPDPVTHIAIQGDGKIVVAGPFTSFGGLTRNGILRLHADGSLDETFDPGEGFYYESVRGSILGMALWRDPTNPSAPERIVLLGGFTGHVEAGVEINGNPTSTVRSRAGIARLNADGTLDTSFDPGTGFTHPALRNAVMQEVLVQPDGKIVAGGSFAAYNGTPAHTLVRLNADGSLDTSFDPAAAFGGNPGSIGPLARSDDGKLLVGGSFALSDPNNYLTTIIRLNENGSKDATFDAGTGFRDQFAGELSDLVLQGDGKVVAAGLFLKYRDVNRRSIARLNADGTLDPSFNPGAGFGGSGNVSDLALQADGKIVAVGSFHRYNGTVRHFLARIHGGAGNGEADSDLRLTNTVTGIADPTGKTTRPSEMLTYTLTYENMSDLPVTDAVVTATLPPGTRFIPARPKDGSRLVTRKVNGRSVQQVEWKIGALAGGANGSVQFRVLVSKSAAIESEIEFLNSTLAAKRNGAAILPDRGTPLRSLVKSLLTVTSTTVTAEAGPGGLITYTFAVRNDGSVPMRDVRLNYALMSGSGFVSAFFTDANGVEIGSPVSAPGGAFNPTVAERGYQVAWYFGKVPALTTRHAKLTVRIWYDRDPAGAMEGGNLVGSFKLSTNRAKLAPLVVPATVATSGQAAMQRPYLGLSKTVDEVALVADPTLGEVPAATAGESFPFTLWYYNIGERDGERVYLQDRIPEGANLVAGSVEINGVQARRIVATDRGRTLVVPIGTVAAGAFGRVSYRVKVVSKKVNTLLESSGGVIGSANLGETVRVNPNPFLVKLVAPVSFSPSSEEVPSRGSVGEVVQHFIRFTNNGGVAAKNARISNPIPPGAKFRGAVYVNDANEPIGSTRNGIPISQPPLDATSGEIRFSLGKMAAGETVGVRVDLQITSAILALNPPELANLPRIDYGPERSAQRLLLSAADENPFTLPPSVVAPGRTGVLNAAVPRFFLGVMAPASVRAGERFTYLGFYGNTSDTAGVATIHLNVPPDVAVLEIVNLTTDRVDPDAFATTDAAGNVVITANIPPHTQQPFQLVCRAIGQRGDVVLSAGHRIAGDGFAEVRAGKPLATYIYDGAAFDEAAARSAVEGALLGAAGVNFAYGRDNAEFKAELSRLGPQSISTILVGADYIALRNGAFAVPLGGGQILVGAAGIISNDGASIISNDGASIISNDGASIISNDGASIISGGAGNIRFEGFSGLSGTPTGASLLSTPAQIISGGAGNLVNVGGHNLFGGLNGAALVNNAGGAFASTDYFRASFAGIVSGGAGNLLGQDGAGIISGGAGNIISGGAGNIISGGGGNLIGQDGAGIISNDGASVTTVGGGNIISGGGGNIISGGAGN